MKRILLSIILVLCIYNALALSNQTEDHVDTSSGYTFTQKPRLLRLYQETISFEENSSALIIHCAVPTKKLEIDNLETAYYSSRFDLKLEQSMSLLNLEDKLHASFALENEILVNGSQTLNDTIFTDYIKHINSTSIILVGHNSFDLYAYNKTGSGYDGKILTYQGVPIKYPFESVIISFDFEQKHYILVYGGFIDGEIAGLRHLKEELHLFENTNRVSHYYDVAGLAVYDYMHIPDNQEYYNTKTDEFIIIMNRSLNGMYNETIIDIMTQNGVLLRAIRMDSLNSDKLLDYKHPNNTLPIVFGGGLWSDIYAWKDLATKMSEDGYDCFMIELTGGPGQDCDDCINYNYTDLIEDYYPALIGTVQTITNSKLNYVGHSNGARTGLDSLTIYNNMGKTNTSLYRLPYTDDWQTASMTPHPIETYIAVGVPGAFDKGTIQTNFIKDKGQKIILRLIEQNYSHITFNMVVEGVYTSNIKNEPKQKISLNLWKNYYNFINSSEDIQPGINLTLNRFRIIVGTAFWTNDIIVTVDDEEKIFENINSSNKIYQEVNSIHTGMCDNKEIQQLIINYLN